MDYEDKLSEFPKILSMISDEEPWEALRSSEESPSSCSDPSPTATEWCQLVRAEEGCTNTDETAGYTRAGSPSTAVSSRSNHDCARSTNTNEAAGCTRTEPPAVSSRSNPDCARSGAKKRPFTMTEQQQDALEDDTQPVQASVRDELDVDEECVPGRSVSRRWTHCSGRWSWATWAAAGAVNMTGRAVSDDLDIEVKTQQAVLLLTL